MYIKLSVYRSEYDLIAASRGKPTKAGFSRYCRSHMDVQYHKYITRLCISN